MSVSSDRWTCPYCSRTTVAHGSELDVAAALAAVRDRHAACSEIRSGHHRHTHRPASQEVPR